jgi:hypothetical protein
LPADHIEHVGDSLQIVRFPIVVVTDAND